MAVKKEGYLSDRFGEASAYARERSRGCERGRPRSKEAVSIGLGRGHQLDEGGGAIASTPRANFPKSR